MHSALCTSSVLKEFGNMIDDEPVYVLFDINQSMKVWFRNRRLNFAIQSKIEAVLVEIIPVNH